MLFAGIDLLRLGSIRTHLASMSSVNIIRGFI